MSISKNALIKTHNPRCIHAFRIVVYLFGLTILFRNKSLRQNRIYCSDEVFNTAATKASALRNALINTHNPKMYTCISNCFLSSWLGNVPQKNLTQNRMFCRHSVPSLNN